MICTMQIYYKSYIIVINIINPVVASNLSAIGSKNLPKSEYIINKDDEARYNILFNNLNKTQKMQVARKSVNNIIEKFTKKQKTEMKTLCMKPKQYIHYIGKWDKLINEVRKEINNI